MRIATPRVATLLMLAMGCERPTPQLAVTALAAPAPVAPATPETPPPALPSETPGGGVGAQADLARLDGRSPVPLIPMMANHQKQNMREHLLAVQEIVQALPASDFGAMEKAASRIGFSEQMGKMCSHMGAGAPGFTELALQFHHSADTIGEAAHRHDRDGVVRALGATLQLCTGCHSAYRQEVVDQATWTRLSTPQGK